MSLTLSSRSPHPCKREPLAGALVFTLWLELGAAAPPDSSRQSDLLDEWWGPAVQGLRCRIELPHEVRQGDFLNVALHLEFDSTSGAGATRIVDWHGSECIELELRDSGGRRLRRPPIDSGRLSMPGTCGGNYYRDLLHPSRVDSCLVPLLSSKGEQLAPGWYTVIARYSNEGLRGVASRDTLPEGSLWTGTIDSAPVMLHVREGIPRPVEFEYFTEVELHRADGEWTWYWKPESRRTIRAEVRPGYLTGRTFEDSRNGVPGLWGRGGDGTTESSWTKSSPGRLQDVRRTPGVPDTMQYSFRVFETSWTTVHFWQPQAGDYREFFSHTVTVVIPPIGDGE